MSKSDKSKSSSSSSSSSASAPKGKRVPKAPWERLVDKFKAADLRITAAFYDAAKAYLVPAWDDKECQRDITRSGTKPKVYFNNLLRSYCVSIDDVIGLLEMFPDRSAWSKSNLHDLREQRMAKVNADLRDKRATIPIGEANGGTGTKDGKAAEGTCPTGSVETETKTKRRQISMHEHLTALKEMSDKYEAALADLRKELEGERRARLMAEKNYTQLLKQLGHGA